MRYCAIDCTLGHGFTCHPAHILVAEHARDITNDVGHPKSYFSPYTCPTLEDGRQFRMPNIGHSLQKAAVVHGGGANHRMGLYDAVDRASVGGLDGFERCMHGGNVSVWSG